MITLLRVLSIVLYLVICYVWYRIGYKSGYNHGYSAGMEDELDKIGNMLFPFDKDSEDKCQTDVQDRK